MFHFDNKEAQIKVYYTTNKKYSYKYYYYAITMYV